MAFSADWIYPECPERMDTVAEAHQAVGFVGAYGLDESTSCIYSCSATKAFEPIPGRHQRPTRARWKIAHSSERHLLERVMLIAATFVSNCFRTSQI